MSIVLVRRVYLSRNYTGFIVDALFIRSHRRTLKLTPVNLIDVIIRGSHNKHFYLY